MTTGDQDNAAIAQQAKVWLARVHTPDVTDADIAALTDWLNLSDVHLAAFDAAELAWAKVPANVPELVPVVVPFIARPRKPSGRRALTWGLAAGIAAAVVSAAIWMQAPTPVVYETGTGEMRQVVLADGTSLHLNTQTRLTVRMSRQARKVQLDHGELAVKVVHDAARPFSIEMGDDAVNDIGTEFNIARLDGLIRVNVRKGAVAFAPTGRPAQVRAVLHAGDEGVQRESAESVDVKKVDPSTAFVWQQGRVIYRDESLAFVIKDLNRYMKTPLVADAATGQLRVTAVMVLDSEASVVKRLEEFLPVQATTTAQAVYLRRRP